MQTDIHIYTSAYIYICSLFMLYIFRLRPSIIYISLCIDNNHITDDYLGEGFIYMFFFFIFALTLYSIAANIRR